VAAPSIADGADGQLSAQEGNGGAEPITDAEDKETPVGVQFMALPPPGLSPGGPGRAGEETAYRQPTGVTILSILGCCLGVLFLVLAGIADNQRVTGDPKLPKVWGGMLLLFFAAEGFWTIVESRKELKLDSQHFEFDNQHIRFDDLTESRWVYRSGRRIRLYYLTCIKNTGEQSVDSLDLSWETAVRDLLDRARQGGICVTEEQQPGLSGWK
jgi:hypothetical protein